MWQGNGDHYTDLHVLLETKRRLVKLDKHGTAEDRLTELSTDKTSILQTCCQSKKTHRGLLVDITYDVTFAELLLGLGRWWC